MGNQNCPFEFGWDCDRSVHASGKPFDSSGTWIANVASCVDTFADTVVMRRIMICRVADVTVLRGPFFDLQRGPDFSNFLLSILFLIYILTLIHEICFKCIQNVHIFLNNYFAPFLNKKINYHYHLRKFKFIITKLIILNSICYNKSMNKVDFIIYQLGVH